MRSFLRWLMVVVGLTMLTAATQSRDWSTSVRQTADGAFVVGNPAAPLKLVEYGSYTCSHCADFAKASQPVLKGQMIRSGKVSLEYRHLVRDRLDLAAVVLARCGGAASFQGNSAAIFAAQPTWLQRFVEWQSKQDDTTASSAATSNAERLRRDASAAGLVSLMNERGLSDAAINACFADEAAIDRIVKMTSATPATVAYTPTFVLNGEIVPNADWERLEQVLRSKGAK